MSIQKRAIRRTCGHFPCDRPATWGVYGWAGDETDVDLNHPRAVFCGQHKPRLHRGMMVRNVQMRREARHGT